jgi:thiol-disulfide isomerase/thioredoxin
MSLNGFSDQNQDGGREAVVAEVGGTEENTASEWVVGRLYAEWCGHCVSMKEAWSDLKKDMEKEGKIKFIDIEDKEIKESNKLAELNEKYFPNKTGVKEGGFPTIFIFQTKNPENTLEYYTGDRTKEKMKTWIETHTQTKGGKTNGKRGGNRKTQKIQKKTGRKARGRKAMGRKTKGKKI